MLEFEEAMFGFELHYYFFVVWFYGLWMVHKKVFFRGTLSYCKEYTDAIKLDVV